MKVTRKLAVELTRFMDTYWDTYLSGNFDSWISFLPDDYRNIGTTNEEIWHSRQEILDYTLAMTEQLVGKAELRNKKVDIIPYQDYFMVHELGDLYVKSDKKWVFYAPIRLSSLLEKNGSSWLVLHQHGSYPDARTNEGEAFALDALKVENKKLQAAVEKATTELERKNKALEVEASMERLRAVAMGMQEARDLLKICEVLFKELEALGLKALRNTMVNLNNDHEALLHNYDYSSKSGGAITEIPYGSHPATRNMVKKLKSSANAFGQFALTGKKLDEWRDYRKRLGEKDDPDLNNTKKLSYYFYSVGTASIGVSTYEPLAKEQLALLEKFRNVFELAYRRYTDIKQAEAQAREAKIEAALEKIRARTMAMQHSSEFPEAANLLFLEVQALGIPAWSCGYNILAEDKKSVICWMSSEGQIQSGFHLPFTNTGEKSFLQWEKAIKDKVPFLVQELGGKDLEAHYDYMRTLPELEPILKELDQAGLALPTYQINHLSFFQGGFLLFITYEKVPEAHDLFKRFTKVFEQTYTRFLDLQKAEAQAREAQIEAALERVRASSMAMHKTQDIADVVVVFFEQLKLLEVKFVQSWINVVHPDQGIIDVWFSPLEGVYEEPAFFKIPLALFENTTVKSWKAGEDFSYVSFNSKEELDGLFKACDEATSSKYFSRLQKKLKLERLEFLDANYKFGAVSKSGVDKATPEEEVILKRFAMVFEQTYTRFLDLQKAEAQAREAEIELALERIRAKSMAMQKSEELADLSLELVKQVQELGKETWFCAFNIYDDHPQGSIEWGSNGKGTFPKYRTPREGVFLRYYNAGQQGETMLINEIGPDECPAHYEYLCSLPGVGDQLLKMKAEGIPFPTSQIDHVAYFKYGYVLFITYKPVPELYDIFKRFAIVFEQSYTRFLDLQKAEDQAREAQIEAALERVRASSMSMRSSDELHDVLGVLFEQFYILGINPVNVFLSLFSREDGTLTYRATGTGGSRTQGQQVVRLDSLDIWKQLFEKWKNDNSDDVEVIFYERDILPKLFNLLDETFSSMPAKERLSIDYFPEGGYTMHGYTPFGYIGFNHTRPPTEEEKGILTKFASEFSRVYQRFLDIQKAEAQAREAQIEAALERVRAASMAMHTSEELKNAVRVIFDQLALLDINAEHAGIVVDYEPKSDWHFWIAETQDIPAKVSVPYLDIVWDHQFSKAKKNGEDFFTILLNFEQKNRFYAKLLPHIKGLTQKAKNFYLKCSGLAISTSIQEDVALYIENFSGTPYTEDENEVLKRFTKVFQQTYTRFLDLQKAEAQAKEAQIEVALERVRARASAMHKAEELKEVASELRTQMGLLGQKDLEVCAIHLYEVDNEYFESWGALRMEGQTKIIQGQSRFPKQGVAIIEEMLEHYKDGKGDYVLVNDGKKAAGFFSMLEEYAPDLFASFAPNLKKIPPGKRIAYWSLADFKGGALLMVTYQPPEQDSRNLLRRSAKVFDLAYRRYTDLQKAEAQTREAQINLGVERVRAKALAMHRSEEIMEVVGKLKEELMALDIPNVIAATIFLQHSEDKVRMWDLSSIEKLDQGYQLPLDITFKLKKADPHLYVKRVWENEEDYFVEIQDEKGFKRLLEFFRDNGKKEGADEIEEFIENTQLKLLHHAAKKLNNGKLVIDLLDPPSDEIESILTKMGAAFDLAYKRFEDLQNAEAQAREAEIEVALERVRAQTMAMHNSEDVGKCIVNMFSELTALGVDEGTRFGIGILNHDNENNQLWTASKDGEEVKMYIGNLDMTSHPLLISARKAWKAQVPLHKYVLEGDDLLNYYQMINNAPDYKIQLAIENLPEREIHYGFIFDQGFFYAFSHHEIQIDLIHIIQRFSALFGQTYRRYLDLVRAEEQAREAQIETALEKVRGRSLAMHNSAELAEIGNEVFLQLEQLGINAEASWLWFIGQKADEIEIWISHNYALAIKVTVNSKDYDSFAHEIQAWKDRVPYLKLTIPKPDAKKIIKKHFGITLKGGKNTDHYHLLQAGHEYGFLGLGSWQEPSETEVNIYMRFAKVFEQAYTRFLDLQKAEQQAREARIETALERVRSRTMAMHSSGELAETALVLFQQLRELGINHDRTNIGIVDEANRKIDFWLTTQKGSLVDKTFSASIDESNTLSTIYEGYKDKKKSIVVNQKGTELKKWISFITDKLQIPFSPPTRNERRVQTVSYISHGMLIATSTDPLNDESLRILERFAAVFDQTYTRFLDLKKAEDQARESQIELSLERIRAQATAMKVSSDLLDIVVTMRTEFVSLGFEAHFFWHMRWLPEKYEKAMTGGDGSRIGMVMTLPRHIHADIELVDTWEKGEDPALVFPMDAETAVPYVDKMITLGDFEQVDPNAPTLDDVRHIGGLTFIMARTTHGEIGYSLPGVVPNPPAEAIATLTRFAGAFDLAYRRFEDLKQAEAREKEAIKDASLDRVRAEIASMRSPKDLERITPLVWKELTTLGVPFFRCGIFIIREEEEMVHAYLSTPAGESLAALHLPFEETEIGMIVPSIDNWRKQTVYREEWDQKRFLKNMQLFMKRGDVKSRKKYQDGDKPPEKLVLQLVPFKQGMLYVGNSEPLVQEHIDLMKDLANAFSIAYSRYEDFVQLEEAKKKVDLALTDLKSAQSQLVHAEKMASLGELTAGIAHEIQNPLNFVNNFSEVNKELMEELIEELLKGDYEEAKAIAQDIMDNDTKIMHHGKRAEGIVKGMLQHSRTSSGKKELTDINLLADEYLRLSYHGLRAKDKSFNADFELDLDKSLPKVNVIPQDIGRVLLNLINNAFYAVNDVDKPKVIVTTKAIPLLGGLPAGQAGARGGFNKIQITVTDNGSGIPENIKDKIFQPFFTTKATGEGTGLGLSLSYDIITKGHGGELKLESQESKGSSFSIILPIQANN